MLTDPIEDPATLTPERLLERYVEALADVVGTVGGDRVSEIAVVDPGAVDAIESGDAGALDLREAAAILSAPDDAPTADAILEEARGHILLEMSTAMLTVDRIAADVEGDLDPKEVQGMVEGRHPVSLEEYARIHHYVAVASAR